MTVEDVIVNFRTTPFLFVGSGISRRYYNLPDWEGLLKYFAARISDDEFAYNSYVSLARNSDCKEGLLPKVAELIQKDFDIKWFTDSAFRELDEKGLSYVKNGISPFKVELASYISKRSKIVDGMENEIALLEKISKKSIAGVITTNYDDFFESHLTSFKKYIGQSQLIFSAIQGVAEIYKIHGSVDLPDSIIINEEDYIKFNEKSSYLAAKLMTIFVENPIIFMGYSISDTNVQKILKSIVDCLDDEQFRLLEDRFVFVEYIKGMQGAEVSSHTVIIGDKALNMRKIQLDDFKIIYEALQNKKSQLPMRLLRQFKEEIYGYVLTNTPTSNLRVAAIDDQRIGDEEYVINIGKMSDFGIRGLNGIEANEWYRNIVISDLDFSAQELMENTFQRLNRQNSHKLPAFKLIAELGDEKQKYKDMLDIHSYEDLIPKTFKSNRGCLGSYKSVKEIWDNELQSLERATRLISHLTEEQMDVSELEEILIRLFETDANILSNAGSAATHIRRLIRIYDYLKWGK